MNHVDPSRQEDQIPDGELFPESDSPMRMQATAILRIFWTRRRTIAGIVVAGTILTALYAFLVTPLYTSTTTLMPPESASSNSNLMSLLSSAGPAASAGTALLGVKTPGALFSGVLGSRTVRESLVSRFGLVSHYKVKLTEDACTDLADNTSISENTRTGIITISVSDKNPFVASRLAQGYVEELNHVLTEHSTSSARRERLFLEERLKQIQQDLDASSNALSQFSARNRTIDMPSQARAMVDAELKLQGELVAARSELAALRQAYSDNNVRVRAARARIDELQRQLGRINGPANGEGAKAETSDSPYPSIVDLPALGITFADLQRKIVAEETLWATLTKQYEAAKVQEAKEIATAQLLDAAAVPERKSYPARSRLLVIGTMLSLFAGCLFVLVAQFWENIDPKDERRQLLTDIGGSILNGMHWVLRPMGKHVAHAQETE
jgi:uncharacterized protein involved in exopolysaccharide biosynthesis